MNTYKRNDRSGGFVSRDRNSNRPLEMHQAICADCGKTCEVPFRPNGRKPVYCKDCFAKNGGQTEPREFSKKSYPSDRSDRQERPSYNSPKPQADTSDKHFYDLKKQLEMMNSKFDRLVSLVETLVSNASRGEVKAAVELALDPTEKSTLETKAIKKNYAKKK
jgi:CxxC-x17-CxxC domain-containing protein